MSLLCFSIGQEGVPPLLPHLKNSGHGPFDIEKIKKRKENHEMKKRIVSLLLALVMAVSLLPVSAFAAEVDVPAVQDVPTAEQQNDENTTPDTPATTEEPTQPEEPVVQDAEPAVEPKVYVTSNVWDKTVEVVTAPESIKGGNTGAFSYDSTTKLTVRPVAQVTVGDTTCNLIAVALNGVRYEKVSSVTRIPDGTFEGFNAQVTIGKKLATVSFVAGGELTGDFKVEFIYNNVPANTEEPLFTPVVASNNAAYGSVTAALNYNEDNSSVWTVTATPADWYKLGYVADEAGNQFASTDGKTAQITVTAADQKFTAYFTAAVAPMYDETPADSVTVNVTLSNDGTPLLGADGTVLANLNVTVPYFDLADYGLSKYYRYGTEFGWGSYNNDTVVERPTALHAYIYLIERYYMGLPADQCGKGTSGVLDYNKKTDALYMDGTKAYNSGNSYAITPTGNATSLYMKTFWGHDENLMYFRNHEYPLMSKGWGSTCDYVLLSDGDRLDVALFSNWGFYSDGAFCQFTQDAYTVGVGEALSTSTFKAGTSAGMGGESPALEAVKDLKVAVYDANWNKLADVTGDGTYTYTFDKAGTYYLMGADTNAKTSTAHYAPATAKVTVIGNDESGAYTLNTAAEMVWFQKYVSNGHPDAKAVLGADINLTGTQWSAIRDFTGTFDGAGHTVTVNFNNVTLFADLKGTVKNLTVAGTITGNTRLGGIAANTRGTAVIDNCVNKANITSTGDYAGGIVGAVNQSDNATVTITNCRNEGSVTGKTYAGGILGQDFGIAVVSITACENHGTVSGATAGGILGISSDDTVISACGNTGTITGTGTAGGILGRTDYYTNLVEKCYNSGSVTAATAGGIVGLNNAQIDSCYNTGAISGSEKVGGITGETALKQVRNTWTYQVGAVTHCYTTGTVTGTSSTALVGAAVGKLHFGRDMEPTYRTYEVYALEGVCDKLVGEKSTGTDKDATAFKTAAELKSDAMLTTLGDAFKKDAGNINNGYPVLVWQVSEACTDHTPGAAVRENEVPATCTKDGSHDEVIYCTVCKTEISRKTITDKATGHKAQAAVKENVKAPTCTAAGSHDDVVYCSVCQAEISRTTVTDKALGHDWDSATGKCKRCETACDHKWTNGKCDTCGYACQHVGGDAVKEKEVPATCTKDGSHDEVVYCTICKAEVSRKTVTDKALGHKEQPAVKENVKAPTCTVDGSHDEVVYCSVCKEEVSRTNVVDKATGHKWDAGVVTTQPTTGKEGVKTFTCTVCKETKTETIDKLGEDQKDQSAANEAINLINGIGTVTKNSKDKIDAARKAYDGLTEDQKKLVPDSVLKTLTDAEAAYAKLTKPGTKPGKPSTSTDTKKDDGKTVKSGQTGDAGIVLYAAMGLLSLTGGALVLGKKKKQD
jgi:LPXTG-motif cell wall-anchored protein